MFFLNVIFKEQYIREIESKMENIGNIITGLADSLLPWLTGSNKVY